MRRFFPTDNACEATAPGVERKWRVELKEASRGRDGLDDFVDGLGDDEGDEAARRRDGTDVVGADDNHGWSTRSPSQGFGCFFTGEDPLQASPAWTLWSAGWLRISEKPRRMAS